MIGIFGGTFDPIHLGHIQVAVTANQQLQLNRLYFVPCLQSPFKQPTVASPKDRLAMIKIAIANYSNFVADDFEIKRNSLSYTVDTLEYYRDMFKEQPICFLLSQEAFAKFDGWRNWHRIIELAHLIIVNRPGGHEVTSPELQAVIAAQTAKTAGELKTTPAGKLFFLDMPPNPISATEIRALLKKGKEISDLVPKDVSQYINDHNLYRNSM